MYTTKKKHKRKRGDSETKRTINEINSENENFTLGTQQFISTTKNLRTTLPIKNKTQTSPKSS